MEGEAASNEGRSVVSEERRRLIAEMLRASGSVSVAEIETRFGVSPMTARRDLTILAQNGLARRAHGGAVLPELAAHEDSFQHRLGLAVEAKERLARVVLAAIKPRETIFFDSSTTAYYVVQAALQAGFELTIITNSLPIMTLAYSAQASHIDLVGLGGSFRKLTQSFVGSDTISAIQGYFADRLVFSVKGITADGFLTDADPLEAEVKRTMLSRASSAALVATSDKFQSRGLAVVARSDRIDTAFLADPPPFGVQAFEEAGAEIVRG